MKIAIDDKFCNVIVDAIDSLIKVYDQYGYKINDIPMIASIAIAFKARAEQVIKDSQQDYDEEEKEMQEHPEFFRGPEKDEKFVMGQGYKKVEGKKT